MNARVEPRAALTGPMSYDTGPTAAGCRLDRVAAATWADERAMRAEERGARAREHAVLDDAGDSRYIPRQRREAELHDRAAVREGEAVALQRPHPAHLRQQG